MDQPFLVAAKNIGMLVVGCVINGLSVGIESAQVPVYIAEISPPSKRGRFIGMQQWVLSTNTLQIQDLAHLWCLQRSHVYPRFLHVPRDCWQDP